MSKLFYDEIITLNELTSHLDEFNIDDEEKLELLNLIDEIFHHNLLNVILNHLPKVHHSEFIDKLTANPGDAQLIEFIQTRVEVDITNVLKKQSDRIKSDLLNEIKKHKGRLTKAKKSG
jgi:hypothetical protein